MAHLNPHVLSKLANWRRDPVLFVREAIRAEPSNQQLDLLSNFTKCKRHTVRSGHGTGKDACASWLIIWFMSVFPYAKVMCTAPTAHQLDDILWSELSKWLRRSILAEEFVIQKQKIFHKEAPKEWWARAVSVKANASEDEQAETLAGRHGDNLFIVVDEASGVPDPVYIPLAGAMTQENNRCLLIGNMTKNVGEFHNTHYHPNAKEQWKQYHWDSRESTNVSEDMITYFRDRFGEDSNVFRIRVMGEPPSDSLNTFIPLSWSMQCVGNEISVDPTWPTTLGVDVARDGEDLTIIVPKQGNLISPWSRYQGLITPQVGMEVVRAFSDFNASLVAVDGIGLGAGVVDWLQYDPRGLGPLTTLEVKSSTSSSDPTRWRRLRDELWDRVRTKCMKKEYSFPNIEVKLNGIDVNLGQELANELASPHYETSPNGALVVESKEKMRARGVASPNIADALCMAEFCDTYAFQRYTAEERRKRRRQNTSRRPRTRNSWMAI